MKVPGALHSWNVTPKQAVQIQRDLAARIICRGTLRQLRLVAGADVAFSPSGEHCIAGVVVWDIEDERVVERYVVRRKIRFPYVPGLLSFRETPALMAALRRLKCTPDVFIFDGQGMAHPRRFGLASHAGLLLDRPSVGCAKSLLVGDYDEPATARGSTARLMDHGEQIGFVLRTRERMKPVFVSVGHRISPAMAVKVVLACCTRYRLPEPTRLADQLVSRARGSTLPKG